MVHLIKNIIGREILNANGKPTVEAELVTYSGICVTASVPSGKSRGKYEAYELYDGGERYCGYGTKKASENISNEINDALRGKSVTNQKEADEILCTLDGTENKSRLGGNAILAVSLAICKAGAIASGVPLYRYIAGNNAPAIPNIAATVISGGKYSPSGLEFEDYMLLLNGFETFSQQLEALVSMRYLLEKMLFKEYGKCHEDGGALAPPLKSSEDAFEFMLKAAKLLKYEKHVSLGIDAAASELYNPETAMYFLGNNNYNRTQLTTYYKKLCLEYPIRLIEDGFDQDDFAGFVMLKREIPDIQIVGDDLFATNTKRIQMGVETDCANAVLLKINQAGTVSETIEAARLAKESGYDIIVSLRSGETEDSFIADFAVGIGAKQIKLGSPVRAERNTKYNRLLRIAEDLENTSPK